MQESDFDPHASGPPTRWGIAKGMWQFIPETGKRFGLNIGPLAQQSGVDQFDDRFNWEKATPAAARYIKDIYSTDAQASGLLVMASYNWGECRVIDYPAENAARSAGSAISGSSWRSTGNRFPLQTYEYVFYIVSAAVIGENPRLFRISRSTTLSDSCRSSIDAAASSARSGRMLHPWTDGPALDFAAIVHGLRLAVFVFHRTRILYQNEAAVKLHARLQKEYQADLIVMLRDHLLRIRETRSGGSDAARGDAPDRRSGRTALRSRPAVRGRSAIRTSPSAFESSGSSARRSPAATVCRRAKRKWRSWCCGVTPTP